MIDSLQTRRLRLTNYSSEDLDNVRALKAEPLVWQYATTPPTDSLQEAQRYLEGLLQSYADRKPAFQALFIKQTGQYVGEAGVLAYSDAQSKAVIGYNLLPPYWHQGLATEITQALASHLFEIVNVERIEALAVQDNLASRRVLVKSGFQQEGLLRNYALIGDRFVNVCLYAMIRADYGSC